MDVSHQPGEMGGGPWYSQLQNLTLIDDFHRSIDRGSTQDDLEVFQSRVLHLYGYLVFIVSLNTGYLNIHHGKPFRFHHDTPDPGYWRDLSSYLLSKAIERHNIHAPFTGIGRSDKIDLCSVIQETGCQLTVNQNHTQIFGTNERTIGEGLLEMLLNQVERLWPSRELICFGEAPSAGGAPSHFSLIMIPHEVIWTLADETFSFLFLLSLNSVGHLDLKITIAS